MRFHRTASLAAVSLIICGPARGQQVDTTFPYQGRLLDNGVPVTTAVDLRFTAFAGEFDVVPSGGPVVNTVTPVDGLFSTNVYLLGAGNSDPGNWRWLEIEVAPAGSGAWTSLGRQEVFAAPFSINTRGIEVIRSGKTYVGNDPAPEGSFQVYSRFASILRVPDDNGSADGETQIVAELIGNTVSNALGAQMRFSGGPTATRIDLGQDIDGDFVLEMTDVPALTVLQNGNVGINEPIPDTRLHVGGSLTVDGAATVSAPIFGASLVVPDEDQVLGHQTVAELSAGGVNAARLRFSGAGPGFSIGQDTFGNYMIADSADNAIMTLLQSGSLRLGRHAIGPNSALEVDLPGGGEFRVQELSSLGGGDVITQHDGNTVGAVTRFQAPVGRYYDVGTDNNDDFIIAGSGAGSRVLYMKDASGWVGVHTNAPNTPFTVNGSASNTTGVWAIFSDERLKHDIAPLEGSLERLAALDGFSFEFNADAPLDTHGRRAGLVAQQVERVFPEWVSETDDGLKMLEMVGFEAHAVEAIKQLKADNDALRTELDELRATVAALASTYAPTSSDP